MSETPNKKRKNEDETKDEKDLKKRLAIVLSQLQMDDLMLHLTDLVKNEKHLKELDTIFPPEEFPIQNLTDHCVRCHRSFDPELNKNFKCSVDHSKEPEEEVIDGKIFVSFECCNQKFEIDPKNPNLNAQIEVCQKTNHTTNKDYLESYVPCQICGTTGDESFGDEFLGEDEEGGFIVEEEIEENESGVE